MDSENLRSATSFTIEKTAKSLQARIKKCCKKRIVPLYRNRFTKTHYIDARAHNIANKAKTKHCSEKRILVVPL